jgi:Zn-dependent protease with chaperone function
MTEPLCPTCAVPLVYVGNSLPWCEHCEFKLGTFKPDPAQGPVGRHVTAWSKRLAYRANNRQYAAIAGQELSKPRMTPVFLVLLGISLLLIALATGVLAIALWLVITGWALQKALGLVLIGVVVVLRPRLGRLRTYREKYDEVNRAEAPELFSLIDDAVAATGAPAPDHVFIDPTFNASATIVGLRRRRVLTIGIPLWMSLRPQERVAVLGHELGHFLNRDVRRGLLTQPACTMFGQLANLTHPGRVYMAGGAGGGLVAVIAPVFMAMAHVPLLTIHLAINVLSFRDGQRAEYYADAIAAKLAGPAAASSLEVLACDKALRLLIGSRARRGAGFAAWRADVSHKRNSDSATRSLQLSLREEASAFATHPPTGLRHRLLSSQPPGNPVVVLTAARDERIDAELLRFEKRYVEDIAEAW